MDQKLAVMVLPSRLAFLLVGALAFMGLYQAFLFAMRPRRKSGLALGLASLLMALRALCAAARGADPAAGGPWLRLGEAASLYLLMPALLAFFDLEARRALSKASIAYGGASLAAGAVALALDPDRLSGPWFASLLLPAAWILVADLALPLAAALRAGGAGRASGDDRNPAARDLERLAAGAGLAFLALAADLGLALTGRPAFLAPFGFLALVSCGAWVLAARDYRAADEAGRAADSVEARVRERTAELEAAAGERSVLDLSLHEARNRLQNALDVQAKDVMMAAQVQQGIFRGKAPEVQGWELALYSLPCSGVSGDFYDFYVEDENLMGLVVGDVSGHGIASGLVTILARSVFWRCFRAMGAHSLGRVLEEINGELIRDLSSVENYLTCSLLRLREGQVEYANAAHAELAYRRAGKAKAGFLVPGSADDYKGPPLGREGIEAPYHAVKFALAPGDSLLVFTDGLTESLDERGARFGAEGVLTAYGRAPEGGAQGMLDYILDDWRYHVGSTEPADDLTAVLLRRKG